MTLAITLFFARLWARAKTYLLIAGAVAGALLYAFIRGRAAGQQSANKAIRKHTDNLRKTFNEIDARRPDFDRAVSKLRDRSRH